MARVGIELLEKIYGKFVDKVYHIPHGCLSSHQRNRADPYQYILFQDAVRNEFSHRPDIQHRRGERGELFNLLPLADTADDDWQADFEYPLKLTGKIVKGGRFDYRSNLNVSSISFGRDRENDSHYLLPPSYLQWPRDSSDSLSLI